jgi:hypothetical protein
VNFGNRPGCIRPGMSGRATMLSNFGWLDTALEIKCGAFYFKI